MSKKIISIVNARENNLKGVDVEIPRNKIVCFVGVSGSGKSTIAFDIIAREAQRQYFESLSTLARRYLLKSNRPEVDDIKGISSAVIISQDRIHQSPRSTVGTLTEAYTYLRLLYARAGYPVHDSSYFSFNHPLGACKRCKGLGRAMDINVSKLIDRDKSLNEGAILYSNWKVGSMVWKIIKSTKYFDMDKKLKDYCPEEMDRLLYAKKEVAPGGDGVIKWTYQGIVTHLKGRGMSTSRHTNESEDKYYNYIDCPDCHGWRLKQESLEVLVDGRNIGEVANLPIKKCLEFVKAVDHRNAQVIKPRLIEQLKFLVDAGVGYLTLNRSTETLSGGEAQRVKLARQLGCDLVETIYVLDEPTAGLHARDVNVVIKNLKKLRDSGNTVLVVEHDKSVICASDHIIEVGPGGGKLGGEIVFNGDQEEFCKSKKSLTARYIRGEIMEHDINSSKMNCFVKSSFVPHNHRQPNGYMPIRNAMLHNLKNISLDIPKGVLLCLTGVSGSGKSSLVEEIICQHPQEIVLISQQAIGNNRRGCLATYVGIFDAMRDLFARENRVSPSNFSYNSKVGQCEECQGLGYIDMDMNFLGNVKLKCEKCGGLRYKDQVLRFKLASKSIVEVLGMTAIEAMQYIDSVNNSCSNYCNSKSRVFIERIRYGLQMLIDVGLDYVELGQTLDTLSGGEAQRLKLAFRLQKKGEFYILDEPTSGLHFADIDKLMKLLNHLVESGNTVMVIEHNLEVIRMADWVIDMGPEGGDEGGYIIAEGTVSDIMKCDKSWTGKYLRE